jgi:hypothetical protein
MRLGLFLGIPVFLLVGGTMNALLGTGHAGDALNYALIGGALAFAGGMYLERKQHAETDNPAPIEYPLTVAEAYVLLRNTIAAYHRGGDWFMLQLDAPSAGQVVASLSFSENRSLLSSEQLARQIVLNARLTPTSTGTSISLRWEVYAQLNRDSCDGVIQDLSAAIDRHLRLASLGAHP